MLKLTYETALDLPLKNNLQVFECKTSSLLQNRILAKAI